MTKKIIAFLLFAFLCLCFISCSQKATLKTNKSAQDEIDETRELFADGINGTYTISAEPKCKDGRHIDEIQFKDSTHHGKICYACGEITEKEEHTLVFYPYGIGIAVVGDELYAYSSLWCENVNCRYVVAEYVYEPIEAPEKAVNE